MSVKLFTVFCEIAVALASIDRRIGKIETMLKALIQTEDMEMATLADLKAKVEAEHTVEQSAVTLLQQIAQMLKDAQAANDPAKIQEIVDMLDANTAELSAAVTANTPAP